MQLSKTVITDASTILGKTSILLGVHGFDFSTKCIILEEHRHDVIYLRRFKKKRKLDLNNCS